MKNERIRLMSVEEKNVHAVRPGELMDYNTINRLEVSVERAYVNHKLEGGGVSLKIEQSDGVDHFINVSFDDLEFLSKSLTTLYQEYCTGYK